MNTWNLLVLKDQFLFLQQFKFQSTQPVHLHLLPLIKMHLLQVIHRHLFFLAFQNLPSLHQGVAAESTLMEDNPFAPNDHDHFINVFAPEPRVFNSPCFMVKSWLVQDQTVLGKDYSNLLIADSLLKTIWFINAPCYGNEALASPKANELTIPEQTATGKGTSNPFMAGSLPKTTKPT
ncbi:hypothetical protein Tco_0604625 [Tanacetum coccineum]